MFNRYLDAHLNFKTYLTSSQNTYLASVQLDIVVFVKKHVIKNNIA